MNDTVIGDPQFTVTMPQDESRSMCYEVHGVAGNYFNLISDTCTSVNALFTVLPGMPKLNRMSVIGIYAGTSAAQSGNCARIQISVDNCTASLDGVPIRMMTMVDDIRIRKFNSRWRVSGS